MKVDLIISKVCTLQKIIDIVFSIFLYVPIVFTEEPKGISIVRSRYQATTT
jgi:hypothetical protein